MKKLFTLATALLGLLLAQSSHATLVLTVSGTPAGVNVPGAANPSDATIASTLGITTAQLGSLIYKQNYGSPLPADTETFAASYTTSFDPTSGKGKTIITYVPTKPVADATYLLLKDGNLGSYVWNISSWNGTETIEIENPFPDPSGTGNKVISHVEFFGSTTAVVVPEPSTYFAAALLGLPVVLGWARKKIAARKA